jgi:hypothetical protein
MRQEPEHGESSLIRVNQASELLARLVPIFQMTFHTLILPGRFQQLIKQYAYATKFKIFKVKDHLPSGADQAFGTSNPT